MPKEDLNDPTLYPLSVTNARRTNPIIGRDIVKTFGVDKMIEYIERDRSLFVIRKNGKVTEGTLHVIFNSEAKTARVDSLVVWKEEQRGKGIGRELMQKAIAYLKQQGYEKLIVDPAQEAIGFYVKMGFEKTKRSKNRYIRDLKN